MARAKSVFIALYMAFLIVLTIISSIYYSEKLNVAWLGALLTLMPILCILSYLVIFQRTARTSASMSWLLSLAVTGVVLSAYKIFNQNVDQSFSFVIAIAGLAMLLLFVFWYSKLDRGSSFILQDHPLPAFTVEDLDGNILTPDHFKGKYTVFLFYRGNWCPICVAQIKEVAEDYNKIIALGAQVVLISPQPDDQTRKLAGKFNIPLLFCIDKNLKAARALGIVSEYGLPFGLQLLKFESDTVLPTVILTDEEGIVIHLDETDNYRVRPEPGSFLKILEERNNPAF